MGNPARAKGTHWESKLEEILVRIYPNIERSPAGTPSCDFVNTGGVRIEAKKVDSPRFLQWVANMRKHAKSYRWAIIWSGDARHPNGKPLMVVDLEFGLELLKAYQDYYPTKEILV